MGLALLKLPAGALSSRAHFAMFEHLVIWLEWCFTGFVLQVGCLGSFLGGCNNPQHFLQHLHSPKPRRLLTANTILLGTVATGTTGKEIEISYEQQRQLTASASTTDLQQATWTS